MDGVDRPEESGSKHPDVANAKGEVPQDCIVAARDERDNADHCGDQADHSIACDRFAEKYARQYHDKGRSCGGNESHVEGVSGMGRYIYE